MLKQTSQGLNEEINLMTIAKGILLSYIVTIPVFMIFAFILANTDFPEKFVMPAVVITTIISILVAGSAVTRNARSKGWLNGGMVGLIYMLLLYIISSVVLNNYRIDRYVVTMSIIGLLTGAIGGIIGINFKRSSHTKIKPKRIP